MMRARVVSILLGATVTSAGAVFGACDSNPREGLDSPDPGFTTDGSTPDVERNCGLVRCSRDLKSVFRVCDGKEELVARCGEDEGCGEGRCVDACTSAELSKGSAGCSFWTLPPLDSYRNTPSCFAATVANTWNQGVTISAEYGSEALDISKSVYTAERVNNELVYTPLTGPLPPGGVAIVFLSQADTGAVVDEFMPCPRTVQPALHVDPLYHGTAIGRAFHLKTSAPVSAYSIYPYGGASTFVPAATLLLPVSSWGTNYVAITTGNFRKAGGTSPIEVVSPTSLEIIADEDDTEVRIRPTADIDDGVGVTGTAKGFPQAWKLSRGQVLQFNQKGELTGSALESTKRVGIFGGTDCTYVPSTYSSCDFLHQQIPALAQWGSEYALVPYPSRVPSAGGAEVLEQVPWRLVGAVDGTVLTYDPARPAGAPERLGAGETVAFLTQAFVTVKSQDVAHPFYAGVYMTGATFGMTSGDPDYVNVAPSDQFLDRYVFFTDHTFPETALTIVRRKTAEGFRPVELECGGEISNFRPLGSKGEYEFAWVKLTVGANPQTFPKGKCGYGRHEAKSDGPFSVTVWGTGEAASYGFVGGVGSRPLNPATLPVPR